MYRLTDGVMLHIDLLGAPRTGKTQLAQDLAVALSGGGCPTAWLAIHDNPPFPARPAIPVAKGLALLMGLDLATSSVASRGQQSADQALRDALSQAGIAYQVVYGQGSERLRSALQALQAWQRAVAAPAARPGDGQSAWIWSCETCSDPKCERRLLSDLLATRTAAP